MLDSTQSRLNVQSTQWQGKLSVQYRLSSGRTYPVVEEMVAPLKLQRPFYPLGSQNCQSVLLHTAGGMVGGDRLSVSLHLMPETSVFWTTPAATKVYRSGGEMAQTQVRIRIEPGARLTWFPLETILFDGARYQQEVEVELSPGAIWCCWEWTRLGRTALGEGFDRGHWRSRTQVTRQGMPLWIDSQGSLTQEGGLGADYGLGGYPVVGSLCWLGGAIGRSLLEDIRAVFPGSEKKFSVGVTRLPDGLLCRYRGNSTEEGKSLFMGVWRILCQAHGEENWLRPRVWPM
ncbi:urease accessory protein UreD [Roseofilum capinflatum]|uniref:Urease accessory protein UreD n=1 Tax=Roseofilum capinflatum BLCC-M114 TaxID=3022440 RepID=A0ABT7B1U9_9CYAN|nr:urease accessory protein UreD [Roseofilum capinflatum]MDJ1173145.1 urease accessory protein UreD [Roseofilum capinflatum BLCC-M114]